MPARLPTVMKSQRKRLKAESKCAFAALPGQVEVIREQIGILEVIWGGEPFMPARLPTVMKSLRKRLKAESK